jgi:predicted NBD/HSP70 family sugar kinase
MGIDVGGTKAAWVVTDASDNLLAHDVEPTQADRLPDQLRDIVRRAIDWAAVEDGRAIAAVGVAVPGFVDPRSGRVGLAVNLGGSDLALGPILEESVGLPCYIEHDARAAAAWVHARSPAPSGFDDLAYLSVGTGISAGLVLGGRVLRGANGLAGEVGHIVADASGQRCACGLVGCYETVAAGPAISERARMAASDNQSTTLPSNATAADLFRAAAGGDPSAAQAVDEIAARLTHIIRGLVLTLGVNRVVVGGGVAAAGDDLLKPLLVAVRNERDSSPLVDAAFAQVNIELLPPELEAGARGAAAIARRRIDVDQREGVGDR